MVLWDWIAKYALACAGESNSDSPVPSHHWYYWRGINWTWEINCWFPHPTGCSGWQEEGQGGGAGSLEPSYQPLSGLPKGGGLLRRFPQKEVWTGGQGREVKIWGLPQKMDPLWRIYDFALFNWSTGKIMDRRDSLLWQETVTQELQAGASRGVNSGPQQSWKQLGTVESRWMTQEDSWIKSLFPRDSGAVLLEQTVMCIWITWSRCENVDSDAADLGGGLILHFQQAPRPWPEAAAPPTTLRVQADGWPLKGGGQPTLGYKWEMWPVWIRDSYTLMYGEVIMVRQSQKSFIQAKLKMPPDIIVHSYLEQVNPSDYLFWDSTS